MPELDWSKISSWNSKGTPKLVQQLTSRSAGNTKLVHRLGAGAARRSSAENEEQSPSAENEEQIKRRMLKYRTVQAQIKCRVQVDDVSVMHEDLLVLVELKLLLVDFAFSARLCEEATRVSQRFGMLTINFSRCVCEERSADGLRAADRYDDVGMTYYLLLISRRAYASVVKRRRLS
ncbi:hypothetical protein F511_26611 [Dorcoceras hygrometricum]|uniref:Uncharacterized protein n=2 Tax=Dorcoceras hygrometricum TaxID=472368 RepID=A0A2Z7C312_9LAMI|nr:hypothetical protein F511_26611 [Dorcoceras hygrometricum]